ncbi:MAG TPA: non-ribosomal peptide synthetase, partial [Lachnospiraceae bacterium]|nr:non-ribosomal peptide synthetase [Lachnospiraceae bacterium]
EWMNSRDLTEQKKYWLSQFEDEIPVLDMPLDHTRPQMQSYEGNKTTMMLDEKLSSQIKELSKKSGATEYMIFLSATMILLSKYSRQEDIVIGSPISGRTHKDTEEMLGMFINTLAMRGRPERTKSYEEFLKEIKDICFKAYENQEYPFEELVEAVQIQRDISRNPLFDVMLVLQNNENTKFELEGTEAESVGIFDTISKFDLTFNIAEKEEGFVIILEYCTALYEAVTAKRILKHFKEILRQLTVDKEIKIGDIEMVTSDERETILHVFNATEIAYPKEKTVVELFEEQVKKNPDNRAVVYEDESISYEELNGNANVLAHKLREKGIGRDDFVAIVSERSIEMIEGIIGIIKAGGAYVPIDPTYPEDRIAFMLEDCRPKALLTFGDEIKINTNIEKIDLGAVGIWEGNRDNPEHINHPEDLIYCIYTSGTTGQPKGVMIEHGGAINSNCTFGGSWGVNSEDKVIQFANYVFDASASEIIMALLNGAELVCVPENIVHDPVCFSRYCKEKQVTVATLPPNYYIQEEIDIHLRKLITAGSESNKAILAKAGSNAYINAYGPTENTICASFWEKNEKWNGGNVPIGKPISNTHIYIMNGDKLCGIGVPGELCLTGDSLARGYLNRPELTAEKFVKNPYGEGRMYRSGDLARWLPDGNIEYLGRIDEQVKIRGFRIELGEIESHIREIEGVKDSAVIAREDASGDKAIYAYYTGSGVSVSDIRDRLIEVLPEYMIPAYMMEIDSIPVTRNGKVDKRALPDIEVSSTEEYVAPRNEAESIICEIFEEILGIERVGVNDDFFKLGGHSLRIIKIINRIEQRTGVRFGIKTVYANSKVVELSKALIACNEKAGRDIIRSAEKKDRYVASSIQKNVYIAQKSVEAGTVYNMPIELMIEGRLDADRLQVAVDELVKRHKVLQTSFVSEDGEIYQVINTDAKVKLEKYFADSEEELEEKFHQFVRPFELETAPLFRIGIAECKGIQRIFIDVNHIVADGESNTLMMKELAAFYNGQELSKAKLQYYDFSEWLAGKSLKKESDYWKNVIESVEEPMQLPYDKTGTVDSSSVVSIKVKEDIYRKLRGLSAELHTTIHNILLFAAMRTMNRFCNQQQIVIGVPFSLRSRYNLEDVLGMMVNVLPIMFKVDEEQTIKESIKQIEEIVISAFENSICDVQALISEMAESTYDKIRMVFSFNGSESEQIHFGDSRMWTKSSSESTAKYELVMSVAEKADHYDVVLTYANGLFFRETAENILESFVTVVEQLVNGRKKVSDLTAISDAQREKLLYLAGNKVEFGCEKTVIDRIIEKAMKNGEQTAVVYRGKSLSYHKLIQWAQFNAKRLIEQGIGEGDIVCILLENGLSLIPVVIGICMTGAAYLPLDRETPDGRIATILESSGCVCAVVDEENKNRIQGIRCLKVSEPEEVELSFESKATSEDAAYVIYTSGSTGTPKGVQVSHRALSNLVDWHIRKFSITESEVTTHYAGFGFDATVWEIFPSLVAGACIHCIPDDIRIDIKALRDYYEENGITVSFLPTPICEQFMKQENHSLRILLTGGDKLNTFVAGHSYRVFNNYGPTENTVVTTCYEVTEQTSNIPIGRPIDNVQVYVGDSKCRLLPPYARGELLICGDSLADGYLKNEEQTSKAFVETEFGRTYRTGDIVKWNHEDELEFIGRNDHQTKVNGNRIELGEIASVLDTVEGVNGTAVVIQEINGSKWITAYYASEENIPEDKLRNYLSSRLPYYMMPRYILYLESIPLTLNGKIDVRALPVPDVKTSNNEMAVSKTECFLFDIWRELLAIEDISIYENFIEAGGNSILIVKMQEMIEYQYPDIVTIADIFANPTISSLAGFIDSKNAVGELVSISRQILIPQFGVKGKELLEKTVSFVDKSRLCDVSVSLRNRDRTMFETVFVSAYCAAVSQILDNTEGLKVYSVIGEEHYIFTVDPNSLKNFAQLTAKVSKGLKSCSCEKISKVVVDQKSTGIVPVFILNGSKEDAFMKQADFELNCSITRNRLHVTVDSTAVDERYMDAVLKRFTAILKSVFSI